MKIALCAGHNISSRGAINKRYDLSEYVIATNIAEKLQQRLIKDGHTVDVIGGKLKNKIKSVNRGEYDLALDIHFNADYDHLDPDDLNDKRGHGCMVMFCPKANTYGLREPTSLRRSQAQHMSKAMSDNLGNRNLGARAGWWWNTNPPKHKDAFLKQTNCAAFIPEMGYIDNNAFAKKYLTTNNGINKLVLTLYNAIKTFERQQ